MVTITRINNGRCDFEYNLGGFVKSSNFPLNGVDTYVLNAFKNGVFRLLSQISTDVDGQAYTDAKPRIGAAAIIAYRISTIDSWSEAEFKQRIANLEDTFLKLIPKPSAATYQKLSQLVFDILIYANSNTTMP